MKKLLTVIDRIEEGIAILELEDRTLMELPFRMLPEGAQEGMAVRVTLELDSAATAEFRREAIDLQNQLRERSRRKKDEK